MFHLKFCNYSSTADNCNVLRELNLAGFFAYLSSDSVIFSFQERHTHAGHSENQSKLLLIQ